MFESTLKLQHIAERPDAIPVVARWWFDEWGYLQPGLSLEQNIERIQQCVDPDELPHIIVAIADDRVVGAAALKLREMKNRIPDRVHWLGNVFVEPDSRGQGIGAALADRIADVAEGRGIRKLHLQTKQLDGGIYAKRGWRDLEQVRHNGHDVVVMVRTLRSLH